MPQLHQIVSPTTNAVIATHSLLSESEALSRVAASKTASGGAWRKTSLETRIQIVSKFVDAFVADGEAVAVELATLIGRPIQHCRNEVRGFEERARYLLSIAQEALADKHLPPKEGFTRFIRREPLGVVLIISAWNYPYLVSVNGVIPALLAGNTVLLKQAPQTFPCADRFVKAFSGSGIPEGVFQVLPIDHAVAGSVLKDPRVNHAHFTGSVRGGREVSRIVADKFMGLGLELGGKDPAYVRHDADPLHAAENLVDGAMYNSGQSCCGIERIYVHESIYEPFIAEAARVASLYKLGDSLVDPAVNLGPVVSIAAADGIRGQIKDAVEKGAKLLVDEEKAGFAIARPGTAYVAPQALVNVDHSMRIMKEETFGPVVGVMKVKSDEEAIRLMNDSDFGLTASIWTKDQQAALAIGNELESGTVFLNRCDYLDPALPWSGVKDSGRGVTLSSLGFDALTRPKAFHFRH
ncbi:Aldehyde/histidinol dehydrogenase [Obelidium mucronatum]|nr:Aldehyde/histidinol dehydrogenase [Obelidium mucronatum]